MDEDTFFVKITEPEKLRVSVLAASKASLESLKIHLKLQELHKNKLKAKKLLESQFAELVSTLHKLTSYLPHQELLEKVKHTHPKSKKKPTSKRVVSAKKTQANHAELDKLNAALEEIEKRLSTLQ